MSLMLDKEIFMISFQRYDRRDKLVMAQRLMREVVDSGRRGKTQDEVGEAMRYVARVMTRMRP